MASARRLLGDASKNKVKPKKQSRIRLVKLKLLILFKVSEHSLKVGFTFHALNVV